MQDASLPGIAALALLAVRFILALVFIRAGIVKLSGLADFRVAIKNYQLLPAGLTGVAALGVPAAEVSAGTLLLLGIFPGITAACLAVLLVIFSVAIAINLARGRVFDCGCGGTAPQQISWRHVAVNMLLAAAAAGMTLAPPSGFGLLAGPGGVFSPRLPHGAGVPAMLAAVLVVLLASTLRAAVAARRALAN
jgi:uncharacterized membrane protein YphA (DoxX/SURF4 family)